MEFQKFDSNCRTECHAKTRALRHARDERYRKGMTGMSGEDLGTITFMM